MFDVSSNTVAVLEDSASIVNRTRLLMLTEPTELYMNPNFGAGLKKYLWQYNNPSTPAIIKDRIIEQLRLHEPKVNPADTEVTGGLLFTDSGQSYNIDTSDYNTLKMTVAVHTVYGDTPSIDLDRAEMYGDGWDRYLGGDNNGN